MGERHFGVWDRRFSVWMVLERIVGLCGGMYTVQYRQR